MLISGPSLARSGSGSGSSVLVAAQTSSVSIRAKPSATAARHCAANSGHSRRRL